MKRGLLALLLLAAAIVALLLSLRFGSVSLSTSEALSALTELKKKI